MIVTIDGPAAAGKTTVARRLARRLGFRFLDTGAMYRAVALAGLRHGVDWSRPADLAELARHVAIEPLEDAILLEGEDVSEAIRSSEVTAVSRFAADNAEVRGHLVALQRRIARDRNVVTEGRDQGTIAFPDAECKVFLTATPEERSRRRVEDLKARGEQATFEQVHAAQQQRDLRDSARSIAPMIPAPDAVEVCTDGLTIDQVVDRLELLVRSRADRDAD